MTADETMITATGKPAKKYHPHRDGLIFCRCRLFEGFRPPHRQRPLGCCQATVLSASRLARSPLGATCSRCRTTRYSNRTRVSVPNRPEPLIGRITDRVEMWATKSSLSALPGRTGAQGFQTAGRRGGCAWAGAPVLRLHLFHAGSGGGFAVDLLERVGYVGAGESANACAQDQRNAGQS